jgi:hypothetical protein
MSRRLPACFGALIVVAVLLAQASVAGQQAPAGAAKPTPAAAAKAWTPTRTAWGDPDLQGVYTFSTQTPLERPTGIAARVAYTEAERAELEEQTARQRDAREAVTDPNRPPGGYNLFWTAGEQGRLTGLTSLIIEPEDGRRPPLTPLAQKTRDERVAAATARRIGEQTLYNTWEDHPMYTRCVARPMPRIGQAYNHGVLILQTPGYVAIYYESMHDTRIIPLDGRPHLHPSIRQWNGDARGRWQGNTLVVDWTNFTDKQEFAGAPQGTMRFTERFRKIDANTINYEVTVTDPATWTRPWTFVLPWRSDDPNYQSPEDLYEYACHEGNYRMMENSLKGSRALKQAQTGK